MSPAIDTGDTAWMLAATALVLMMTIALGLFYAGLVRAKNTLNTFMMCVAAIGIAGVTWALLGYSLAFDGEAGLIGGLDHFALNGVGFEPRGEGTIPHLLFMAFQGTFCIITVALIAGAVVERMRFGAFMLFAALWSVLVYAVLAHWAFGGVGSPPRERSTSPAASRSRSGSGFSALAAALVVGAARTTGGRRCSRTTPSTCWSAPACSGSAGSASTAAAVSAPTTPACSAFVNTLLTPACALLTWFVLDLIRGRKVTAIGAATAIIVGCVLITPAGGFVSPGWAMVLGFLGALPCYAMIVWRPRTRVDETLDVLAAHGIAGFTGILFLGLVAQAGWNGVADGLFYGDAGQFWSQVVAAVVTPVYAFVATFILLKLVGAVMPLRASEHDEAVGMDVVYHGEEAYASGEGAILVTPEADGELLVADPG